MSYSVKIIWEAITESAKNKFDYNSFADRFEDHYDDDAADYVLFNMISSFANNFKIEAIQLNIFNQMTEYGVKCKEKEIKKFIEGKEELFKIEIQAVKFTYELLSESTDVNAILQKVKEFLNSK